MLMAPEIPLCIEDRLLKWDTFEQKINKIPRFEEYDGAITSLYSTRQAHEIAEFQAARRTLPRHQPRAVTDSASDESILQKKKRKFRQVMSLYALQKRRDKFQSTLKSFMLLTSHNQKPAFPVPKFIRTRHLTHQYAKLVDEIFQQIYYSMCYSFRRSGNDKRKSDDSQVSTPLLELVFKHEDAECKVVADKVYGVMSLSHECCREATEVDYEGASAGIANLATSVLNHYMAKHADPQADGVLYWKLMIRLHQLLLKG